MVKKLTNKFSFNVALKVHPSEGNLVYEYNPFFNYRLNETKLSYKNRIWNPDELAKELKINWDGQVFTKDNSTITTWDDIIPANEEKPIVYQKGQLVDFETDELKFSLNNPVNILALYSYDNSVNLIINDGTNPPRLINSRFSATEKNKYLICDRKDNNDSNIYDQGDEFDVDTSLYRKITNIPLLYFSGVGYGGGLSIGNYHFYFRYVDDDGNMSDFFAESGLVSIFIGSTANSIYSGFRNENSHKLVKFVISNTDPSYLEVIIYYTKATSDINQNATVSAYKIDRRYRITTVGSTLITITGLEEVDEVDLSEINPKYLLYGSAETQELCQNRLFLANVDKPKIPYEDLADCALRFCPVLDMSSEYPIEQIGLDYTGSTKGTYYDPDFIYNKVGYHYSEIYRFGVVFILLDNTLSDVFNVRGIKELDENPNYTDIPIREIDKETGEKKRRYIKFNDLTYSIIEENNTSTDENVKGVVKICNSQGFNKILGVKFKLNSDTLDYLKNTLHIKGVIFVRQKRIPTTLCQAYTIGVDNISHTPVIPDSSNGFITESFITKYQEINKKESKESRIIDHDRKDRIRNLKKYLASSTSIGALCPEYDVNSPYFNSLFTGTDFKIEVVLENLQLSSDLDYKSFCCEVPKESSNSTLTSSKIIGVEDNVKLVAINDNLFSARAGEAEEANKYEYIGLESVVTNADNLIRGSYGPYLGITGYNKPKSLINIKIPGYSELNLKEYFEIRFHDKSAYYPISYRLDLQSDIFSDGEVNTILYRGDCYICQFTHRVNRNFQDPSSPANDKIVDPKCWKDNYKISDGVVKLENFEKINLGDLNAVKLGMYVTMFVRSTINLNVRAIDESNADEEGLFGHSRAFYPKTPMSNNGCYKIPEALCYNKGFEKSVSEKVFFEIADVPWIKNEFSNRIAYSEILVTDAFLNGWRTFLDTHYRDYPKTYGSITKIVELRGNLVCVFEHGVALIPVNERAVAGEGSGGNIYINTSNVLPENPKVISDTFGSQWRESVIKTPIGIYGVDTVAKKIWRTNGQDFECISDFKILKFLNDNISLKERDLEPIIGIKNVKTHYNKFKHDIMFTFYNCTETFEDKAWNICFNEALQLWSTFYSWIPSYSENIYNQFFSFDRNTSKQIALLATSKTGNNFSGNITLGENIVDGDRFRSKLTVPESDAYNVIYTIEKDDSGNYKYFNIDSDYLELKEDFNMSDFKSVVFLNIKATLIKDDIVTKIYNEVIALATKSVYNSLTTNFWKHGLSGIIDISNKVEPCNWYGKLHPFEFEFIIADNIQYHKIFDNLLVISNSAEPESFHYEIVGDCYDFAKEKKNMYIRLEATKQFYQYNGSNICFDSDYINLDEDLRKDYYINNGTKIALDRSTIFPLYYLRLDTRNEIEDSYHQMTKVSKDLSALAGAEVTRYDNEFRIWNHAKATNIQNSSRLRGNMLYLEDKWNIQINPLNFVLKNEEEWKDLDGNSTTKIPIEIGLNPIPSDIINPTKLNVPDSFTTRGYVIWKWLDIDNKEAKIKDKWLKVRIRYSGKDLAIISAIQTLYSISYS